MNYDENSEAIRALISIVKSCPWIYDSRFRNSYKENCKVLMWNNLRIFLAEMGYNFLGKF